MNGYHELDGVPCAANEQLLNGILRGSWGFDGIVVADYFSVDQLAAYHGLARSKSEAAVLALGAGIDVELPSSDCFAEPLLQAVETRRRGHRSTRSTRSGASCGSSSRWACSSTLTSTRARRSRPSTPMRIVRWRRRLRARASCSSATRACCRSGRRRAPSPSSVPTPTRRATCWATTRTRPTSSRSWRWAATRARSTFRFRPTSTWEPSRCPASLFWRR